MNNVNSEIQVRLLDKTKKPIEFFAILQEVWLAERKLDEKTYPACIVQLTKNHDLNIIVMAMDAIDSGFSPFNAVDILALSIADLELNESSIVDFAECLYEKMSGDMMAGRQSLIVENMAKKAPEQSRRLLAEFLKIDRPFIVGYVSKIFQILAIGNEHEVHGELCGLIKKNSVYVKVAVVDALCHINYGSRKNRLLLKTTFEVYEELGQESAEEISRILVYVYAELLKYSAKPKKKLVALSKSENLSVKGAIARILYSTTEGYFKEEWYSQILLSLIDIPPESKDILSQVDYALSFLLGNRRDVQLAEQFVSAWVIENAGYRKTEELPDLFSSTFHEIVSDQDILKLWVTKFLNSNEQQLNQVAAEIVSYCQLHRIPAFSLDKGYLKNLDVDDCVYICRKILGYLYSVEYLCTLCFSILDKSPSDKELKGLVYSVFAEHIGDDFTTKTIEFLNSIKIRTKSKNKIEIASLLIKELEGRLQSRKDLPVLNELCQSSRKEKVFARESGKKMAEIMKEAEKKSVFLSITSKIELKQGTGSFHFHNGEYSEVSRLSHFSESYEVPRSQISHQVDAAIQIFNFCTAKRGQS